MLASISIILQYPALICGLLSCIVVGGLTFLAAIHLCRVKGLGVATLKYILTVICVQAVTTVFMILLAPIEFLQSYTHLSSINVVIGFILFWILIYEAKGFFKHPRLKELKQIWSTRCR